MAPQFLEEWVLIPQTCHMQHPTLVFSCLSDFTSLVFLLSILMLQLVLYTSNCLSLFPILLWYCKVLLCRNCSLCLVYPFPLVIHHLQVHPNSFRKYKCEVTFSNLLLWVDNSILCVYDTGVNLVAKIINHEFYTKAYFHCTHLTRLARVMLFWTWKA